MADLAIVFMVAFMICAMAVGVGVLASWSLARGAWAGVATAVALCTLIAAVAVLVAWTIEDDDPHPASAIQHHPG